MFQHIIPFIYLVSLTQAAPKTYGVSTSGGKITGGDPSFIEEYPYQASLQYSSSHICGAVVISEEYVLTAAHCTDGYPVSTLTIRAGTTLRNSGGIVIQVATVYQNQNYNYTTIDYDISVLRLASPLSFGSTIAPVALPEFNQPIIPGSISQISGWGLLAENAGPATQLQATEVPIVSLEECRSAYKPLTDRAITKRMVCAGHPEGYRDACKGDSGGPVVVNGTLIGLVSWSRGCGRAGIPGVHANVPALRNYITSVTGYWK